MTRARADVNERTGEVSAVAAGEVYILFDPVGISGGKIFHKKFAVNGF